jgi:hypothetical protein
MRLLPGDPAVFLTYSQPPRMIMSRSSARIAVLASLLFPASSLAQEEYVLPSPEEYAEAAERAENAPLFLSEEPLRMTLRTDIDWLRDERNDSVEVEGTLTFVDTDGSEVTKPVDTRARGNFRRSKKNCNFPPLRLDFKTKEMEGTVFEDQDKLKLVTPCNDGRDDYQRYIFNEYLAYRILNVLTPVSFRVRLVEVTYEDTAGDYETRTKIGFLIEDEDEMAARSHGTIEEVTQFHPARTFAEYSVLAAMFNYMIGNTDWSPAFFHNVKLVRTEDARYLTVPYDFDFSGTVNARYASVDPSLQDQIRTVTRRLYRGFCRDELVYDQAVAPFRQHRAEIEQLYRDFTAYGFEQWDEDRAEDSLKYFEDFWKVVDNPKEFESKILRDCREW